MDCRHVGLIPVQIFGYKCRKKKKKGGNLVGKSFTFQDSGLLGDADLPLGDDGFALGVADVGWDEGEAGLLLRPGARVVQGQQLPVRRLE